MDVDEINTLTVINPNAKMADTSNTLDLNETSNYRTSDELSYGENNVQFGESNFAKSKRTTKVILKLTTFTTLLLVAVATGSFVFNSFLGNDPVIENFDSCYRIEDLNFIYSFDMTIDKSYLTMEIFEGVVILPTTYDFKESGTYEGSIPLKEHSHYTVKFISTNGFDYSKELKNYELVFSTN